MRLQHDFQLVIIDGRPAIRGDCDFASVRDIEGWLATFDGRPLEVDLSGVTFFDSSALRAVLNARGRNPHVRVVKPSKAVVRALEITGTTNYLVEQCLEADAGGFG